jgi:hypothetical protein
MNPISSVVARAGDIRMLAEVLKDPGVLERLASAAEKNERSAVAAARELRALTKAREEFEAQQRAAQAEGERALQAAREAHEREVAKRMAEIAAMEAQAKEMLTRAEKDGKAAAALKRDLDQKLARLHELAA